MLSRLAASLAKRLSNEMVLTDLPGAVLLTSSFGNLVRCICLLAFSQRLPSGFLLRVRTFFIRATAIGTATAISPLTRD